MKKASAFPIGNGNGDNVSITFMLGNFVVEAKEAWDRMSFKLNLGGVQPKTTHLRDTSTLPDEAVYFSHSL